LGDPHAAAKKEITTQIIVFMFKLF